MNNDNLENILDEALADFDKPPPTASKVSSVDKHDSNTASTSVSTSTSLEPPSGIFKEFFSAEITEKLEEEWNLAMQELDVEDPELAKHLKSFSQSKDVPQATASMLSEPEDLSTAEGSVDAKVKKVLESMAKTLEDDDPNDDMMKQFLSLDIDGHEEESGLPGFEVMEDMMKTMLSKEFLYPPMKEMCKKYPDWLKNNAESISKADEENYMKQLNCVKIICSEFENEKETDSDSVKKERLSTIMTTVNEMQSYGQPPPDLLGEQPVPSPDACNIS